MTFVYILECSDGSYYTGWTTDLDRRVAAHNAGQGGRYTRSRRPVELVYWEEQPDRRSAQQRELALKRWPRSRKLALIAGFRPGDLQSQGIS
ncbi:MAG: GIY-YIG nuclease family protein [Anaerolineales bacterium]|nr:MAG: GIY-YIG nuclease family protein [Anaerolineales bacterium]